MYWNGINKIKTGPQSAGLSGAVVWTPPADNGAEIQLGLAGRFPAGHRPALVQGRDSPRGSLCSRGLLQKWSCRATTQGSFSKSSIKPRFNPKTIDLIIRDYLHMLFTIKNKTKRNTTNKGRLWPSWSLMYTSGLAKQLGFESLMWKYQRIFMSMWQSEQSVRLLRSSSIMGMRCENSSLFLWDSSRPHKQHYFKNAGSSSYRFILNERICVVQLNYSPPLPRILRCVCVVQ